MLIVPFEPAHLENLLLQPAQAWVRPYLSEPEYAKALAVPGMSFAALEGGRVLACAGIQPLWAGRAEAWALMSGDLGARFLMVDRAVRRFLRASDMRRIEANVDAKFGCARRWIEMLGFRFEGEMPAYTPDGRDCLRYARVRT